MTSHLGNAIPTRSNFQKQLLGIANIETHTISPHLMISQKNGYWEICQLTDKTTQTWKIDAYNLTRKYVEALARELFDTKTSTPMIKLKEKNKDISSLTSIVKSPNAHSSLCQKLSTNHFRTLIKNQNPCTLTPQRSIHSDQLLQLVVSGKVIQLNDLIQHSLFYEAAIRETFENSSLKTLDILTLFFFSMEHKLHAYAKVLLGVYKNHPDLQIDKLSSYLSAAEKRAGSDRTDRYALMDRYDPERRSAKGPAIIYAMKFFGHDQSLLNALHQAKLRFFDPKIYREIAYLKDPALVEFWHSLLSR